MEVHAPDVLTHKDEVLANLSAVSRALKGVDLLPQVETAIDKAMNAVMTGAELEIPAVTTSGHDRATKLGAAAHASRLRVEAATAAARAAQEAADAAVAQNHEEALAAFLGSDQAGAILVAAGNAKKAVSDLPDEETVTVSAVVRLSVTMSLSHQLGWADLVGRYSEGDRLLVSSDDETFSNGDDGSDLPVIARVSEVDISPLKTGEVVDHAVLSPAQNLVMDHAAIQFGDAYNDPDGGDIGQLAGKTEAATKYDAAVTALNDLDALIDPDNLPEYVESGDVVEYLLSKV